MYLRGSEDSFPELGLFFHHVYPWDQTRITHLGTKLLYASSHPASPLKTFFFKKIKINKNYIAAACLLFRLCALLEKLLPRGI